MKKHVSGIEIIKSILCAIIIVLIFCAWFVAISNLIFYRTHNQQQVKGFSMRPTINTNMDNESEPGDTIYISLYSLGELNDIVVADPLWHDNLIIKRLVGLPGDKIEIRDLEENFGLFVNDKLLYTKEKYGENLAWGSTGSYNYYNKYLSFLNSSRFSDYVKIEKDDQGNEIARYILLEDDEYFLMGDNWGYTLDCLSEGPISKSELVGKVDLIVDIENDDPFFATKFILKKIFSFN